jgi:hypothetical protein
MKFVFLKSGDYIDFEPPKSKFVESWFEYLFNNNLNLDYTCLSDEVINSSTLDIEKLNKNIDYVNNFSKDHLPDCKIEFDNCNELDQKFLNISHKKWVNLTNKYSDHVNGHHVKSIHPEFHKAWQDINRNIHSIEKWWSLYFGNNKTWMLPDKSTAKITQEDCTFDQQDLILEFDNLGKHQFDQWATGTIIDEETNNYEKISASFRFIYKYPYQTQSPAPSEYVTWCNSNNVSVLPNYVNLGKFPKYDIWTVKKLMYKNLKIDKQIGFSN